MKIHFRSLLAAAMTSAPLLAQCAGAWDLPSGFAVAGTVRAMTPWDPDGAGPAPTRFVVAGAFAAAGGIAARNIVSYDPVSGAWSALGAGVAGVVKALEVLPNGALLVAGTITEAGTLPVSNIATWDGASWQAVGGGTNGTVDSLVVTATGTVFAGGLFTQAGGIPANNIARWNGSVWSSLGAGLGGTPPLFSSPGVAGLALLPNGDLVAVGGFSTAGALSANQIARWDGTSWSASGLSLFPLTTIVDVTPAVGGVLVASLNPDFVSFWDGATWSSLGPIVTRPFAVRQLGNGDVVIAGGSGLFGGGASRYRSGAWTVLGTAPGGSALEAIAVLPGMQAEEFVVGGGFGAIAGVAVRSLARWSGLTWVGDGALTSATAVGAGADGRIVVAGDFQSAFGVPANRVIQWDGAAWSAMGGGLPRQATDLVIRDSGEVLALAPPLGMYRWNGSTWSLVAGAPPAASFVVGKQGQLALLGGTLFVESGGGWTSTNVNSAQAAAYAPDGSLIAGGFLSTLPVNGRIGRWTGTAWQSLDPTESINGTIEAIAVRPDGEVFAGGTFQAPAFGVVRRVGTTWQQVGTGLNGTVSKLRVLRSGEVLAVGNFSASGAVALPGAAIWNGVSWAPVPDVFANPGSPGFPLLDFDTHPGGDWLLVGQFVSPAPLFARFRPGCPAAAVSTPGCGPAVNSGTLVAPSWPLLGGEFVARGTQLPANGLALAVSSPNAANLPLNTLLPFGVATCTLLVAPELLELVPLQNGSGVWQWSVPVAPALIGATFRHQWLVFDLGGPAGIISLAATQMLQLTLGSFL